LNVKNSKLGTFRALMKVHIMRMKWNNYFL
jgi:hypothetical protein